MHHLEDLPTKNVIVTFSLNPESVADAWEGKYPDGVRVTPPVSERVEASLRAETIGFEVRWRIDPILTLEGWEAMYQEFFVRAAELGAGPSRITLGTYRENSPSLRKMATQWGLASMEWTPAALVKEGMHYHIPRETRIKAYRRVVELVEEAWAGPGHTPRVALCKEPGEVRRASRLLHDDCNCGP